MPRSASMSSTSGVTPGSGPLSNESVRSNTSAPSGRGLQRGAGCDLFRILAARPAVLPDRGLAFDPADRGVESDRHREHEQHAREYMRAVEDRAVARDQVADAGRRDQHFRDDHADDNQRATDAQTREDG